jgi:hypothetical protein
MIGQAPSRRPNTSRDVAPAADPRHVAAGLLAAGIDRVMARLDSPDGQPESPDRLARELRAALARIAARGAICYLPAAADQVRAAAVLLDAGTPSEARALLGDARTVLDASQPRTPGAPHRRGTLAQ